MRSGTRAARSALRHVEVSAQQSHERLLELLIGERVAERVHGAVGVAQEVREHVQVGVRARRRRAEALDERQDVVRRPTGDERAEDERDGAQRLAGPVLALRLLALVRLALLPPALDALADRAHEVGLGPLGLRLRLGPRVRVRVLDDVLLDAAVGVRRLAVRPRRRRRRVLGARRRRERDGVRRRRLGGRREARRRPGERALVGTRRLGCVECRDGGDARDGRRNRIDWRQLSGHFDAERLDGRRRRQRLGLVRRRGARGDGRGGDGHRGRVHGRRGGLLPVDHVSGLVVRLVRRRARALALGLPGLAAAGEARLRPVGGRLARLGALLPRGARRRRARHVRGDVRLVRRLDRLARRHDGRRLGAGGGGRHARHAAHRHGHHGLHLLVLGLGLLLHVVRRLVDAAVQDEEHDERGPVVADDERRVEHGVLEELDGALALAQVPVADEVLPAEDGDEEEQGRDDPGDGHHPQELGLGAPAAVLGGDLHRAEAVDGDEEDRVLRHEAHGVVDREPQVAQDGPEVPVAHDHVHRVERHGHGADEHVGGGERGDEVVARLPDAALHDEREQHEDVAADGEHDADAEADDDADALPHLERHRHARPLAPVARRAAVRGHVAAAGERPVVRLVEEHVRALGGRVVQRVEERRAVHRVRRRGEAGRRSGAARQDRGAHVEPEQLVALVHLVDARRLPAQALPLLLQLPADSMNRETRRPRTAPRKHATVYRPRKSGASEDNASSRAATDGRT